MSSFIPGSDYNDTLTGDAGENVFYGSLGNDTLDGYGGIDTVNYRTLQNASAQGYTLVSGVQANLAIGRVQNGPVALIGLCRHGIPKAYKHCPHTGDAAGFWVWACLCFAGGYFKEFKEPFLDTSRRGVRPSS